MNILLLSFLCSLAAGADLYSPGVNNVHPVERDFPKEQALVEDVISGEDPTILVFPKISLKEDSEFLENLIRNPQLFIQTFQAELRKGIVLYSGGYRSDRPSRPRAFLPEGLWLELRLGPKEKGQLNKIAETGFFPYLEREPCLALVQKIFLQLGMTDIFRFSMVPHLFMKDILMRGLNKTKIRAHLVGVDSLRSAYSETRERDLYFNRLSERLFGFPKMIWLARTFDATTSKLYTCYMSFKALAHSVRKGAD